MPDSLNRFSQFWQELKRRRVVKVVAMYAATAFIILEVVDIVSPALLLPSWTVSLVIILLAIGFPIAVILSWIFDVTPDGIKKTVSIQNKETEDHQKPSPKRRLQGSDVIIAVLFVAVVVLVYPKLFSKDKFENIRELDGRISIAVMPFENLTNDTLWNVWQAGIQNELISNLSNSEELSVRQYQTMQEVLPSSVDINQASLSPNMASEISRKLEANTFIQGTIKSAGTAIRLNANLIEANSEEVFKTFQLDGGSEDDIFIIIDSLSRLVRNYLEIKVLEQEVVYDLRSGNSTGSADAYRNYLEGMNFYFAGDAQSAIDRLKASMQHDPEFFAAYDWLIQAYEKQGFNQQDYSQIEQARLLVNKVLSWDTELLSRRDQISREMIIAKYVDKNPQQYIRICRQMLGFDPKQRVIWHNLGKAYELINQHDEAIVSFEKAIEISNQWGIADKWVNTYKDLGSAYHHMHDFEKERKIYDLGLSYFPDHPEIIYNMISLALVNGDSAAAKKYESLYETTKRRDSFWTHAESIHRIAHIYAGVGLTEQSEQIWLNIINLEPNNVYHKRCFAEFLILHDVDIDQGMKYIDGILEVYPDYYDILFFKGMGLYKQGKLEEALETLKIAWEKRLTYRHDHYLAIQEVERALGSQ